MNPILVKLFLLLENIWIHISSILDIDPQLPLRKIHLFKLLFLNKKHPQLEHIEAQLTQSISKFLFNEVKDFNLALENPKYSPNALEELEQYLHNFEVEDIERLIVTQNKPHHWLQTDIFN